MDVTDDDLLRFETEGALPLPQPDREGKITYAGARVWYGSYGAGAPVVLLHGVFGSSNDWGYQVASLLAAGRNVIVVDSRGRGRSTLGTEPPSYESMACETVAVMDALELEKADIVGWSDGAVIGLLLAMQHASRVDRVFAFGVAMNVTGLKTSPDEHPRIRRMFSRTAHEYSQLSETPNDFKHLTDVMMRLVEGEPNYHAEDVAAIRSPIAIVTGEEDEFIKREHSDFLVRTIPAAQLVTLPGVTHFAPLQRPRVFSDAMLAFLRASLLVCMTLIAWPSAGRASVAPISHCIFTGSTQRLVGSCGRLFDQEPKMVLLPATGTPYGMWSTDLRPTAFWRGEMTDEDDPKAPIQLEVYRNRSGIMRTIYGWFPVSNVTSSSSSLTFDLDGGHEVPPNALDRKIVQRASTILSSDRVWNRADNRQCPAKATSWSIYCAMEKATAEVSGGVDHRRPALEVVRDIIDERTAGRKYNHRLMDYNNDRTTTLADVQAIFAEALKRMQDMRWLADHGFARDELQ